MAKKFSDLRSAMSAEAQNRSEHLAKEMLSEMPLHELRQARGLSQQPAIAKLERRTDMYLSTLRSHIEAMGGELEIVAHFPDGSVRITNFSALDA